MLYVHLKDLQDYQNIYIAFEVADEINFVVTT